MFFLHKREYIFLVSITRYNLHYIIFCLTELALFRMVSEFFNLCKFSKQYELKNNMEITFL